MTKNEALQMCLEYIETDAHERKYVRHAIKAALEQPAQPEQEVSCRFCHDKGGCWAWQCYHCGEIDDVQQPTPPAAQPMQEPVAWRDPTNIDPGQGCTYKKEWREKWPHIYRQALYTTPPAAQRPWVGLTEDEIKIAWAQLWYDLNHGKLSAPDAEVRNNVVVFGQALEAMLKEKNNG